MKCSKDIFMRNKIIPMANRSDGNIEEDETYQMFIKLANNYDFYLKMKEEFHCKLNKKSPTKQWQKAIVPEKVLHKAKEKSKSKKKVLMPVKNKTVSEKFHNTRLSITNWKYFI